MWDQSPYKQTVVQSYGPGLRVVRPLYGVVARALGARPLPAPGEKISSAYASFVCVEDDDADVMACLLRETYNEACRRRLGHLMIGLGDDDPLLGVAGKYANITYRSRVFAGSLVGGSEPGILDARPTYVEIATL